MIHWDNSIISPNETSQTWKRNSDRESNGDKARVQTEANGSCDNLRIDLSSLLKNLQNPEHRLETKDTRHHGDHSRNRKNNMRAPSFPRKHCSENARSESPKKTGWSKARTSLESKNLNRASEPRHHETNAQMLPGNIEQSAETGQWLEAGRPLFELVATEGMVIEAAVSTSDWFKLNVGQRVELSASVASDDFWVSEVSWIAPSVDQDNSQGNRVAVRFPPGDDAPPLLLGQEVDVNLSLERVNDVIVLPLQAVIEESPELSVVYVLDGDQARRRTVSLGLSSLTDVEVVDGLSEGEIVILPGGQPLREGQSVLLN